jgi:hypothetical protein
MNVLHRILALGLLIPALQGASLPLVIVVRDGAGNPLPGVALEILVEGPPHELYDTCVTDAGGACRLVIPPGAYLIRFIQGWRGLEFVSPDEQNAGVLDDGTTGGGFGVYFEPSEQEQVVTFVVGVRDGQLIPLWDMSRDPLTPPQPFALPQSPLGSPEEALEGIDLGALVEAQPAPAVSTPTAEAQVVTGQVEVGAAPTVAPTPDATPPAPAAGTRSAALSSHAILLGLIGLAGLGGILLAAMVASRRWLNKRRWSNR